jgi:hypothetical protein
MQEEMNSLLKNDTWDRVPLPQGCNFLCCKWAYITKFSIDKRMDKFKSHLINKGFSQFKGIDYSKKKIPCHKGGFKVTCSFTCYFSKLGSTSNGHQ